MCFKKMTLIVAIFSILALTGCTYVKPGYVGVKVNQYGGNKGVSDTPLLAGKHMYFPWTTDIILYPSFIQNIKWTESIEEGSPTNQAITFQTKEGANVTVDIGLSYSLDPAKIPALYSKFKVDIDILTDGYVRNIVRDLFIKKASEMESTDIYSGRKAELLQFVEDELKKELAPLGIIVDRLSLINSMKFDAKITTSINSVIEATQRALEAENKIRQTKAEAQQLIEEATGKAQARLTEAKAEAEANLIIAKSITPELIKWNAITKWNGTAPTVLSVGTDLPVTGFYPVDVDTSVKTLNSDTVQSTPPVQTPVEIIP